MDAKTFDRLVAAAARRPTRRATLQLLAGGLLGMLLPSRGVAPARAVQRLDSDQDGLFDDDEVDVYGTNPDVYDTDGDNVGDGEEIYNRDNGLGGPSDPLVKNISANVDSDGDGTPDGGEIGVGDVGTICGAGLTDCGGSCVDLESDRSNCGNCAVPCYEGAACIGGICLWQAACPAGQTDCGGSCVDLAGDEFHCGACFNSCPLGGTCQGGVCGGVICMDGRTDCGGTCVDLASDEFHCGACYNSCPLGGYCAGGVCGGVICQAPLVDCYGRCVDLDRDWQNCGACGQGCFEGAECVGGACV